jgi:hypothetical protein
VQDLQSQADISYGVSKLREPWLVENRNRHGVLAMRQGNHGAVPADAGTSGALPGLFSSEADRSVGLI